ncbi:MAG: molybdenum cofactor guanylyltransferase [Clostridia bacterium]|jgi:molybdopterin-guanine dinucleotide biosynthesis protein A|nr:molybdenum cofactor guanylyltransferase [Clostridia bacterium]
MLDASAIILAGGKNSRMNYQNKALLKFGDGIIIEKIIKEVSDFKQIIVSTNDPTPYTYLDVKLVKDIYPSQGPLSGIHAGLANSQFSHSLVLAFDMPFIKRNLLEYLVDLSREYDAVVPRSGKLYQPLCAIYAKACLPYIEANLKLNIRKATSFYKDIRVKYVDEQELKWFGDFEYIFRNINTPSDYKNYCFTHHAEGLSLENKKIAF